MKTSAFKAFTFPLPAPLDQALRATENGAKGGLRILEILENRLALAKLLLNDSPDPALAATRATIRTALNEVREAVGDFFSQGLYSVAASPYTPGLPPGYSSGEGLFQTLPAPKLIRLCLEKLRDKRDQEAPRFSNRTSLTAVLLMVTAASPRAFRENLEAFHQSVQIDEISFALRKIKRLETLERERFRRRDNPIDPKWRAQKTSDIAPLGDMERESRQGLAFLRTQLKTQPLEDLTQALNRRKTTLKKIPARTRALRSKFSALSKSGLYSLSVTAPGTAGLIQAIQNATNQPPETQAFSAGVLWVAERDKARLLLTLFE